MALERCTVLILHVLSQPGEGWKVRDHLHCKYLVGTEQIEELFRKVQNPGILAMNGAQQKTGLPLACLYGPEQCSVCLARQYTLGQRQHETKAAISRECSGIYFSSGQPTQAPY